MESENMDFEKYLSNALKQYGYLFPETDSQMAALEKKLENVPLPEEFENPEFVFNGKKVNSVNSKGNSYSFQHFR